MLKVAPKLKDELKVSTDPKSSSFQAQAKTIIEMLDCAVAFLGPDLDSSDEFKYVAYHYGIKPDQLPHLKEAVILALAEMLGSKFNSADKKAWSEVFDYMIATMVVDKS